MCEGKPVGICSEELRCSQGLRVCDTVAGRKRRLKGGRSGSSGNARFSLVRNRLFYGCESFEAS